MIDENGFKMIEWHPYPETNPGEVGVIRSPKFLVTMKDGNVLFTTVAEWRCVIRKNEVVGYRWIYCDRVSFPWNVIAWADLPEPYKGA